MADEFSAAPPDPELYDGLPEEVVKSVLNQAGFSDTADTISPPSSAPVPEEEAATPEPETPPQAPGGPLFRDTEETPDVVTLPDGRQYPIALVEEWANSSTRPPSAPPPVSPPPFPHPEPLIPPAALQLPTITEEDLIDAGPAVRALLLIANAQAQQMQDIRTQMSSTRDAIDNRTLRDNAEIANSAASNFQTQYNLPEDLMSRIKDTVQTADIESYLSRDYDTYRAVEYALTRSYWNLPEARQFEFERQTANRNAALARKQKLTGVSGSSGSGPRNTPPPDLDTPEGRHNAAVEMARQAMFGDEGQ